ncbi:MULTISPECIES: SOS response-associated peptidase [unclassified Aminobacter]|uniref:SOS response-associated peptidase n=1 Tax=unclassified Aminobacter TaxID=2644704 RepID=UPI000465F0FC|nr:MULTISPECIES: SOS response-associated peptidase [unclassified Aminobacter]TWG67636.1 putative SOS response-associated peptidase YedK [Aminobacter sp. J44]TWH34255.1 putative SOS response-associated peptidase YedK [Aminobacter sp. J15]
MCGRFALIEDPLVVEEHFAASGVDAFPPRYNIAPTQPIMVIGPAPTREQGSNQPLRHAYLVRWGFIPSWVKDVREFPMLINARSETAAEKASFRAAMRHRRVLIPASGFYEWRKLPGKKTQPYWIRPRHGGVIAFAGLVETYAEPGGSEIDTGAILTTGASGEIAKVHDRAPVVVQPEDYSRWLDCITQEPRDVSDIMKPVQPDFFEAIPVSDKVNKVANVGPDLQERVPEVAPASEPKPKRDDQLSLF